MSFIDRFNATDWGQGYRLLTEGDVPLILQLLILNTVFLVVYIARSATMKHRMRQGTVMAVQAILLLANLAVVMQDTVLPVVRKYTIL